MAENQEGTLLLVPPRITTERDKDRFAEAARLLAIGYEVKAICLILEAWAVFAKTPDQKFLDCPPSQSRDRVEVVALTGEMKGCTIQELCRIVRDDKGAFQEFGTPPLPRVEKMEGRFAGILPRQKPSIQEVQMARFTLAGLGYRVEGINDQQSLN
jgi:hypothetical protein